MIAATLLQNFDAFYLEDLYCGELESGVEADRVLMRPSSTGSMQAPAGPREVGYLGGSR